MKTFNRTSNGSINKSSDKINLTRSEKTSNWLYINLEYLDRIAPDNKEFFNAMLSLFRDNSAGYVKRMEDQIQKNDFESLAKTAHAMKPTGSYIGLSSLAPIVAELEDKAKSKKSQDIPSLLIRIANLVKNVNLEIDEYMSMSV